MEVAFTGHRPRGLAQALGITEYQAYSREFMEVLVRVAEDALIHTKATFVISGGALGVDQAAANAAINLGIPFVFYLPFDGFEARWPQGSITLLKRLEDHAAGPSTFICEPGYAPWKMQKRNEAMVDACDRVISFWNASIPAAKWAILA